MRILGIVCSPRREGNTELLVREALTAAQEAGADQTELVSLAGQDIQPCDACDVCAETGRCIVQDDFQAIYDQLLAADGFIFGTPVYFWGVSAQAKALIDRTYCLAGGHRALFTLSRGPGERRQPGLRNKAAGIIVVARRAGATSAFTQMADFLRVHHMIEGGGAIAYGDEKGDALKDEQGLREARWTGRAVVRAIQQRSAPRPVGQ